MLDLLENETKRHSVRNKAYMLGMGRVCSNIAHLIIDSLQRACELATQKFVLIAPLKTLADQMMELPGYNF